MYIITKNKCDTACLCLFIIFFSSLFYLRTCNLRSQLCVLHSSRALPSWCFSRAGSPSSSPLEVRFLFLLRDSRDPPSHTSPSSRSSLSIPLQKDRESREHRTLNAVLGQIINWNLYTNHLCRTLFASSVRICFGFSLLDFGKVSTLFLSMFFLGCAFISSLSRCFFGVRVLYIPALFWETRALWNKYL